MAELSEAAVETFCRERSGKEHQDRAWIDAWTRHHMSCRSEITGLRKIDITSPEGIVMLARSSRTCGLWPLPSVALEPLDPYVHRLPWTLSESSHIFGRWHLRTNLVHRRVDSTILHLP